MARPTPPIRRASLTALAALLVAGPGPLPSAGAPQRAAASTVTIPFELATRHVIVKVSVNKSRPLSFLLDTGADKAIIRTDVAKELGLSLYGSINAAGAGAGRQGGSRVKDATWSLVGLEGFAQPVSLTLPMPLLPAAMGRDIDGIIGGEFIKEFVVELDYQERSLTLHDPGPFKYAGRGAILPLEFNSDGHPVLKATVSPVAGRPIEGKFLLDIGSGLALALHSPFVTQHRLAGPEIKTIRAIGGAGAGGRVTGRLGRVASLRIGLFTIDQPIAMFAEDKAGAFANPLLAGNIGAQIASRFRSFLDYGRKRIILEPSPTFADPFDRAISGLALRTEAPDYRTFRVHEVLEESAATEAGIQTGDIITAIDGTTARNLTMSMIHEMFERPVPYQLTIRRGDQMIRVTLTPRKLL
jgi:hypothetical protein